MLADKPEQPAALFTHVAMAAVVMGVVIAGEYVFRHYVLFWMPTVGSLRVTGNYAA